MRDWLGDNFANEHVRRELTDRMVEEGRAIVRLTDMDALVAFAAEYFDVDDEELWRADDVNIDVMLAISHWRKERRDWTP